MRLTASILLLLPMFAIASQQVVVEEDNADSVPSSPKPNSSLRGGQSGERQLNFWGAIGDWFTGCPAGNTGDRCSVGCPCRGQNTCEAWHHVCRAPGKVNDSCHATKPCGSGLTCEAGSHKCRAPGKENDPCHLTRPCGSGLTCEAGSHVCRAPGKHGDYCHATRPCGSGYWCVDAISAWNHQICLPDCKSFSSSEKEKMKNDGYSAPSYPGFGLKWDGGVVPFAADCDLENNELALFSEAMKDIEDKTGIQFVRYDSNKHDNYIVLSDQSSGVANSWVGKMQVPGWQRVNLDTPWMNLSFQLGSAIHELMHMLGWPHTQSRPDRDAYVTINYSNIESESTHNFDKDESDVYEKVQKCRPYNYDSIMHYSSKAFSRNGRNTITTKDSSKQSSLGNRDGLTAQDIDEIKSYYFGKTCGSYSKLYIKKWPHCENVKCMRGSLSYMERECNKHNDCTGFSFSAGRTRGNGCLKKCGNNDSFNGYGYGSHDYWKRN